MRIGDYNYSSVSPALVEPHCIVIVRPWINSGDVAFLVLQQLLKLGTSRPFASLVEPSKYYDLTRYRPHISVTETNRVVTIPNTIFTYVKATENGLKNDFVLLNVLEPHSFAEQFVFSTSQILNLIKPKKYTILGAVYSQVPHTLPLPVGGYFRNYDKQPDLSGVTFDKSYQGQTSSVSLLTEHMIRQKVPVLSLVASLPNYIKTKANHLGVVRMLEVFDQIYGTKLSYENKHLADSLINDVDKALQGNKDVQQMLVELEKKSKEAGKLDTRSQIKLEPAVEQFLDNILTDKNGEEGDSSVGPKT